MFKLDEFGVPTCWGNCGLYERCEDCDLSHRHSCRVITRPRNELMMSFSLSMSPPRD